MITAVCFLLAMLFLKSQDYMARLDKALGEIGSGENFIIGCEYRPSGGSGYGIDGKVVIYRISGSSALPVLEKSFHKDAKSVTQANMLKKSVYEEMKPFSNAIEAYINKKGEGKFVQVLNDVTLDRDPIGFIDDADI